MLCLPIHASSSTVLRISIDSLDERTANSAPSGRLFSEKILQIADRLDARGAAME
jgi:hypothetical protein